MVINWIISGVRYTTELKSRAMWPSEIRINAFVVKLSTLSNFNAVTMVNNRVHEHFVMQLQNMQHRCRSIDQAHAMSRTM